MTGSMPYIASGASFALLESLFNGDGSKEHKFAVLRAIESADHLMDAALEFGNTDEIREYINHINGDWFGLKNNGKGWEAQRAFDPSTNRTTGWWEGAYIADAEGVCRDAAVAALKLALGLDAAGKATRNDHIGAVWICSGGTFTADLRRWPGTTVLSLHTPGVARQTPAGEPASGPLAGGTHYPCPPTEFAMSNALWLVSQCEQSDEQKGFRTSGSIVTVQPSVEDGGVHAG